MALTLRQERTALGTRRSVLSVSGMSIVELRPHLYRLTLGRYQGYLWRDDDAIALIDTGEAGSGPAIIDALRQIGVAPVVQLVHRGFLREPAPAGGPDRTGSRDRPSPGDRHRSAQDSPRPPQRLTTRVRGSTVCGTASGDARRRAH